MREPDIEQAKEIAHRYATTNDPIRVLAEEYGMSPTAIRGLIEWVDPLAHAKKLRNGGRAWKVTIEDAMEMAERYVTTKDSLAKIAEDYGVSLATVKKHIDRIDPLATVHKQQRGKSAPRGGPQATKKVPGDDYLDIARRYVEGETLDSISQDYDVSRERIRQIIKETDPNANRKRKLMKKIEAEVDLDEELFDRMVWAYENDARCRVCGAWVLRGPGYVTCSSECAYAWPIIRTLPEEGTTHRIHMAKTILRDPENCRPSQVEWAKRIMSEGAENVPPNRRFFVEGSERAEIIKKYRPEIYAEIMGDEAL